MESVKKIMNFLVENWTAICALIVIAIAVFETVYSFLKKSKEEQREILRQQVESAKQQVRVIMLRLVTEAEKDYREWVKAGEIKRAQVIDKIFEKYPILLMVTNQADLIQWIDDMIEESLKKMREIFEENQNLEAPAGKNAKKRLSAEKKTEG